MTSQLTSTGLVLDTTTQIVAEISGDETSLIDAALDTSPDEPLGQINGIFASDIENALQLLQAIYSALDPNAAVGQQLDVVGALRGIPRNPADSTIVQCTCNLDNGHVFTAAPVDKHNNPIGPGQLNVQIQGHPEFSFVAIGYMGEGPGGIQVQILGNIDTTQATTAQNYTVTFACTQTGAIPCNAGTLTVISPAVGGFNSCTNAANGALGAAVESDTAYRLRQQNGLVPPGGGTFDSMRTTLNAVTGSGPGGQGVITTMILDNDTDVTDGNGVLPHSFVALIWDNSQANNNAIAQAIWNTKPAGVRSYDLGTGTSGAAVDGVGTTHTVPFARVTALTGYINITIAVDSTFDTVNGPAAVAAALAAYGNTTVQGQTQSVRDFEAQVFPQALLGTGITGVRDITVFQIGTSPSPTGTTNITIPFTQIVRYLAANIAVSTTAWTGP